MTYLHVTWYHDLESEPVQLYSELDDQRNEIRKVEVFKNGRARWASLRNSAGDTTLSEKPLPTFQEIAEQPGFKPRLITEREFEKIWLDAVGEEGDSSS